MIFWLVAAGFGAELTFIRIMVSLRAFCVFCLLNALVIASLFFLVLDPERIWQLTAVTLLFFVSSSYLVDRENLPQSQGRSAMRDSHVIARVDGYAVTGDELFRPLAHRIYDMESEIYELKRKHLDEIVRSILIQKEAERKGLTVERLVDALLSEQDEVTDEEIESYRRRPDEWKGSQEALKSRVRTFLRKRKARERIQAYADSLKGDYAVEVFLEEPSLPFTNLSTENSPVWGETGAPVKIVEFSDYMCPACREGHEVAHAVRETYGAKVQWIYKDFPLDIHDGARELAEAARCAGEQGKFWEYQALLFASDVKPGIERLRKYAKQLELDAERFENCLESGRFRPEVEENISTGLSAGVSSTPTYFINGKLKTGAPTVEEFREIIDAELKGEGKYSRSRGELPVF
jgi:predicted DsbA family dithiol-disulfide isomerase